MLLLSLALGGLGLMATVVHGAPQFMTPEQVAALCQTNERLYTGPPMPRILRPTISGTGCPSGGKIRENYMGKWMCSRGYDVQFLIPDLDVSAAAGGIAKGDCTISFYVDKLGPGWQLSLWDGVLDVDAEIGRGSELRMKGTAKWDGLEKEFQGGSRSGYNSTLAPTVKYSKWAATINFGTDPTKPFSPCADANGEVGNLTVTYSLEADARFSSGPAVMRAGSWTDTGSGVDVQIENAATLNLKWLIREC
ncbi:hypothetical protein B0T14DRAFT_498759 [Immersiella caudata]|uniref:Uncharacterized protein n=1 Tax=Immersiella caudata TaxID=314043 RepID=A0AA39WD61_9PEZI|nr:hypothetical protein B0T14DRAFT_498759 [Immersiella caudata]